MPRVLMHFYTKAPTDGRNRQDLVSCCFILPQRVLKRAAGLMAEFSCVDRSSGGIIYLVMLLDKLWRYGQLHWTLSSQKRSPGFYNISAQQSALQWYPCNFELGFALLQRSRVSLAVKEAQS